MAIKSCKSKSISEFGDFQTPLPLALAATKVLSRLGIRPRSILEPTCGRGSFVAAAAKCFPAAKSIIGVDINPNYLVAAATVERTPASHVDLRQGDFFKVDWASIIAGTGAPWLILGNPPWVTSSYLGSIKGKNLPEKSNFQGRSGIEAITGKSNFDISEWMMLQYLNWLKGTPGCIAVLCKTSIARKILLHVWTTKYPLHTAQIYKVEALEHFGAAVDACFFIMETGRKAQTPGGDIFDSLDAETPSHKIGFSDGHIISDIAAFNRHREIMGPEERYIWRSGIKHDCTKVMELALTEDGYRNGLGETVILEDDLLFPMLKSSDVGNGRDCGRSVMLVTQQLVGQDTSYIKTKTPKTWEYLNRHSALLSRRASTIYKNKPAFSIFGVGPYSFAPWKVAISGFYKKLHFLRIAPFNGRPIVFDDTINFLPCWSEEEARFIEEIFASDAAQQFLGSMIYWNDKRPITVDVLKRLSIRRLAAMLGVERDYSRFTAPELPLFAAAHAPHS
ncbi:MAG: SAM-dependent DNA methyltransferase [Candidatus Binataceae bacterium]|nr:SAM-dependent DNA methyltransferase [Candidatus Binataceae bacterium]